MGHEREPLTTSQHTLTPHTHTPSEPQRMDSHCIISPHNPPLSSLTQINAHMYTNPPPPSPHDLPDVGRDEVADELLSVVVDGPPLLHSRHDGGEVVVSKNHSRMERKRDEGEKYNYLTIPPRN